MLVVVDLRVISQRCHGHIPDNLEILLGEY